jgi:hypothetical protein
MIGRLVLLPIGMKFVEGKEATSSPAVAGTSYGDTLPNSSDDLALSAKVRVCDLNASFSYEPTNLFQPVQADVR